MNVMNGWHKYPEEKPENGQWILIGFVPLSLGKWDFACGNYFCENDKEYFELYSGEECVPPAFWLDVPVPPRPELSFIPEEVLNMLDAAFVKEKAWEPKNAFEKLGNELADALAELYRDPVTKGSRRENDPALERFISYWQDQLWNDDYEDDEIINDTLRDLDREKNDRVADGDLAVALDMERVLKTIITEHRLTRATSS